MPEFDVIFLLNSLGLGGSERKVAALTAFLQQCGWRVSCAYLKKPDADEVQFPDQVPLNFLDRRGRFSLRAIRALLAQLRGRGPSVLVAVNAYPTIYVALLKLIARRYVVRTVCLLNSGAFLRRRDRWYRPIYQWTLGRMDCVVYGSEAQRAQWLTPGSAAWGRSRVLYNGVRLDHFDPPDAAARERQRQQLGVPVQRFVFGSVGRHDAIKNQSALLAVLAGLRRGGVDAQLLLVGDGPLRSALQQQAHALGMADYVTWTGALADVRPALAAMDAFMLPSIDETFSNAALEAMAMARPVLLSRVGGAAEMISHEIEGFLLDPRALVAEATRQLAQLASDASLRARMGAAARARVERQFSVDEMNRHYLRLLSV